MSSGRSTRYRVELVERAVLDLEAIYGAIGAENSLAAFAWYNQLEVLVFSLDRLPIAAHAQTKTASSGNFFTETSLTSTGSSTKSIRPHRA